MSLKRKMKKGFTLVELVVVIAVIAILSAVSVGAYFGITESAKQSQAEQEAKAFHTNLVLLANTPDNAYCTISPEGLTLKDSESEENVIKKIAKDSGIGDQYPSTYVIHFIDHVESTSSAAGSTTVYECIKFGVDESHYVYLDVVTGAKCTGTNTHHGAQTE